MDKKKRTSVVRTIYIGVTILAIILIGVFTVDIQEMADAFAQLNLFWLLACVGCLLFYWLTDAVLLGDITSYMYKRESFGHSLKVGIIGLYYGALTPFATGGQPMQVVYMRRRDMPVGTATCIVSIKFVVYELSLCALYTVAIIMRGAYFYHNHNEAFWFTTIGFIINLLAVVFIILTLIKRQWVQKAGNSLVRFFGRIRLIRKPDKTCENLAKTIEDYHEAAEYLAHNRLRAIGSFFISLINLGFFFAISYFIYRAFGFSEHSLVEIMTMQAFLYLAISFFPTPGGAGAAEGGFHFFFGTIFDQIPVFVPMLIWRFLSYYLILIVGSILVVLDEVCIMRRISREAE